MKRFFLISLGKKYLLHNNIVQQHFLVNHKINSFYGVNNQCKLKNQGKFQWGGGGVWQAPPGMENPGDGVQRVWIFSGTTQ